MEKNDIQIRTEGLSFIYASDSDKPLGDAHPALSGVDLTVRRGEYVAILGHNGSGKSTLAKLLNLILVPTSGRIYIDGDDVSGDSITEEKVFEVRKKIGMVFQNPDNQLVATVVEEDVAFGPENLGIPREQIRERVDEALQLVDMVEYAKHAPHKLSGGQKQRIAIAGVIAMRPECIIFDESTAMLDPIGRRDIVAIMEKLNRESGITVINITHYMDEAARADRVVVINDGSVVMDASAKEVFSRVEELHEIGLEAPQGLELINELRKNGIQIEGTPLTPDGCVELLLRVLGEKDK